MVKALSEVQLVVAPDKTELISTSRSLTDLVRLTIPTSNTGGFCRKLGVDVNYNPGVPIRNKAKHTIRHKWQQPVRLDRDKTFNARQLKCRRMLSGAAYRKVHRAGLTTGALYGTEVALITDSQLARMRTAAVRAEGIWSAGTPSCV